jgi:rod shape determining protein RodA
MLELRLRKNLDILILLTTIVILILGEITLYSVTKDSPGKIYEKQLVWIFLGMCGMVGMASLDYSRLEKFSKGIYITNLFMLALVMVVGSSVKGATRWISIGSFQMQPSEFAKIFMIICLAVYLSRRVDEMEHLSTLLGSFLYMALPMILIFKQPDLGTSLVLLSIWFGMAFMAGAKIKHLALILLTGILLFSAMWKLNIIKPYQKTRFYAFINPDIDPQDAGYHVIQSRIAIGSGKLWGKGFNKGTQSQGKFIPENHTDFIFTVIGEEGGFVLSALLVFLYTVILIRGAIIMGQAEDMFGRLLAAGVVSMYAFHIIVNIGMTIGIMPVTGVPLPLFSYGGSNLLLNLSALGLLLGIGMRRNRLSF